MMLARNGSTAIDGEETLALAGYVLWQTVGDGKPEWRMRVEGLRTLRLMASLTHDSGKVSCNLTFARRLIDEL